MIKIAVYGKGGIGKSTTVSNLAAALSEKGLRVMQIGCDPKADSTTLLTHGAKMQTALGLMRERNNDFALSDMAKEGFGGVICVEAGGPTPGLCCAGRGMIAAIEKLEEKGAYETFRPDVVFYDVLGDVVCGGFSMPMRAGYADRVFIVTSGENMALHAAANIAMAVENFRGRGYASLGGLILNRRNVKNEEEKALISARPSSRRRRFLRRSSRPSRRAKWRRSTACWQMRSFARVRWLHVKAYHTGRYERRDGAPWGRENSCALCIGSGIRRAGQGRVEHRPHRHADPGRAPDLRLRGKLPARRGAHGGGNERAEPVLYNYN